MKIIFLDYDGVLNKISPKYATATRVVNDVLTMAEPELVYRLNLIVDRTDAELVLSSAWRHQDNWREAMKLSGIFKDFLDRTPRRSDHKKYGIEFGQLVRGHNIQDWIDDNPGVSHYAIIDDMADMLEHQLPNFFRTDTAHGLTQEIADSIQQHLS